MSIRSREKRRDSISASPFREHFSRCTHRSHEFALSHAGNAAQAERRRTDAPAAVAFRPGNPRFPTCTLEHLARARATGDLPHPATSSGLPRRRDHTPRTLDVRRRGAVSRYARRIVARCPDINGARRRWSLEPRSQFDPKRKECLPSRSWRNLPPPRARCGLQRPSSSVPAPEGILPRRSFACEFGQGPALGVSLRRRGARAGHSSRAQRAREAGSRTRDGNSGRWGALRGRRVSSALRTA